MARGYVNGAESMLHQGEVAFIAHHSIECSLTKMLAQYRNTYNGQLPTTQSLQGLYIHYFQCRRLTASYSF